MKIKTPIITLIVGVVVAVIVVILSVNANHTKPGPTYGAPSATAVLR